MSTEVHPFTPFLPEDARILFLGSFPPQEKRWSMPFYYPNWTNDFWRVMGLLFYDDRDWFAVTGKRRFDIEKVKAFCREQRLALYDTACEVRRLQDNASDKFLEVVRATDIPALLERIPQCNALVTTGQKATDVIVDTFGCAQPPMGGSTLLHVGSRTLAFWRMPSTSRAYPLPLHKKAQAYKVLFDAQTDLAGRQIRAAAEVDIPVILSVIQEAKGIMRASGNIHQWADSYPSADVILEDIGRSAAFVVTDNGRIVAYFACIPSPDPTYSYIEGGSWIEDDRSYHVIHRIASTPDSHGVFKSIMDWCFAHDPNIRIDTHRDNRIMQHCILDYGFSYRGIIYLANGDERLAYQKLALP